MILRRLSPFGPSSSVRFHNVVRFPHFLTVPFPDVRVRFAPSPTGDLHLGSLRTALYNYLFARKHKGSFILRIEDTDQTRKVSGSFDKIHRILDQYGLNVDEGPRVGGLHGPYEQSQRLHLYKDQAERLIASGHAYRCFCSEQRLEILRKNAARSNTIPKYDRKCRSVSREESEQRVRNGEPHVIRFKMDKSEVSFEVFGPISQVLDESDMIILKSDGFPTYHLANVVDDREMRISHVIRGMEWLSSTGKHVSLYKAFNTSPPKWVHLPLITRDGKKKLSKRDKDAFVDFYSEELGAQPIAVLNLMIRNGSGISGFDSARLYTKEQMIENFDLGCMGKRNLQLDEDVLRRLSRLAFQQTPSDQLIPLIRAKISADMPAIGEVSDEYLHKVIDFLKTNEERFAYLSELTKGAFSWFFTQATSSEKIRGHFDSQLARSVLEDMTSKDSWSPEVTKAVASSAALPQPKFMQLLRFALIDSKSGPPIQELISFFGVAECQLRAKKMAAFLTD